MTNTEVYPHLDMLGGEWDTVESPEDRVDSGVQTTQSRTVEAVERLVEKPLHVPDIPVDKK